MGEVVGYMFGLVGFFFAADCSAVFCFPSGSLLYSFSWNLLVLFLVNVLLLIDIYIYIYMFNTSVVVAFVS